MAGPRGATALALFARLAFHASALPTTISSIHSLSALTAEHAPPAPPSDSAAAAPPPSSAPLGVVARVTLSDLAAGGEAVGRLADGRVVFVPGGATGEVVEVAIDAVRKGYARGSLRRIVTASPDRVTPPCSLAAPGRCGGCPLMHLRPSAQHAAKHSWVARAVRHSGAAVLPMLSPTPPLHYRLRARLVVTAGQLSFAQARSSQRQPITACPVLHPQLAAVLLGQTAHLCQLLGEGGTIAGLWGHLHGVPSVQLAVELTRGERRAQVREELRRLLAGGVISGARLGEETLGAPSLDLASPAAAALGPLAASADGFAQASEPGHSLLPQLVAAAVQPGWDHPPSVLELYAGSGNLTRALLGLGGTVLAVEGDPRASERLQVLAHGHAQLTVRAQSVEVALPVLLRDGPRAEVIVLDPPRGGARAIVPLLGAMSARRIVYVSCDAMTLGRDLGELAHFGFRPRTVQPIDLMPHTAEVECVAVLER